MRIPIKNLTATLVAGLLVWILLLVIAPQASAAIYTATGNPDDTNAGTVITALATQETIDYKDINNNAKPTVIPSTGDINITVLPVYGFSIGPFNNRNLYVGQSINNALSITNEGNASDSYTMTFSANFGDAGTGTWIINIRRTIDDSLVGTLTLSSASTSETRAVAEDADYGYYHQVTAPADGDKAAFITIKTGATTEATQVGQYTGANGLTYGGVGYSSNNVTYTILKPVISLTRTATVDAPIITNPVGYTGGIHDAVPGSIITYTLNYNNTGNISGESNIIVDKVPANSNLAHFNVNGSTTNVNITPAAGSATGWAISYSIQDSPDKSYGVSTGWFPIGSSPPYPSSGTTYSNSSDPNNAYNAKWVKWEKAAVLAAEAYSVTWGVTIR
jgi:hypothetical protein